MNAFRYFVYLAALLPPAGMALPASANDTLLFHPANLCIQERVDSELGPRVVDQILSEIGLAQPPVDWTEQFEAILKACLERHGTPMENGEPSKNGQLVGSFMVASAMRNEAQRQLEALALDLDWLDDVIEEERPRYEDDPTRVSEAVFARLSHPKPDGLNIDVQATEADRMTGALIYVYIFGQGQADRVKAQLAHVARH